MKKFKKYYYEFQRRSYSEKKLLRPAEQEQTLKNHGSYGKPQKTTWPLIKKTFFKAPVKKIQKML